MKRLIQLLTVAFVASSTICSAQSKSVNQREYDRAIELVTADRFTEFDALVDSMLVLYPTNSDMLILKAEKYCMVDNFDECMKYSQMAIDNVTKSNILCKAELFCWRGHFLYEFSLFSEAVADYTEALNLAPKKQLALRCNILNNRGLCYEEMSEYHLAEADYLHVLKIADDISFICDAKWRLGMICALKQQHGKALQMLNELWEYDYVDYNIYYALMLVYANMGDMVSCIDNAIACARASYDYDYFGVITTLMSRDLDYALEALHRSIAEDVDNEHLLAHVYLCEAMSDYDTAIELYGLCTEYIGAYEVARMRSIWAAWAGNHALSIVYTTEALANTDDVVERNELLTWRIFSYMNTGEMDKAMVDALQIVWSDQIAVDEYEMLGYYNMFVGNYDNALQLLNRGIELYENASTLYFQRGKLYLNMGDQESAYRDFERVLELDTEVSTSSYRYFALGLLARTEEADEWLSYMMSLPDFDIDSMSYDLACYYACIGATNEAIDFLSLALNSGIYTKIYMEMDRDLDSIRDTVAYKELMNHYL